MDREKDTFREMCAYQSLTIEAEESLRNEEGSGNSKSFSASEYAFGLVQSKGSKWFMEEICTFVLTLSW